MSDENWPARTPRDEMLTRVAARGSRIRAVRGAMNALVILSVVGASALGVGAMVDSLGDGDSTEVENIAIGPEPPEIGPGPTASTTEPTDGDPTSTTASTTGSTAGTTPGSTTTGTTPGSTTPGTPGTTGRPGTPGTTGRPGSSSGGSASSGGSSTSTSTSRPTTTAPPASTPPQTTTTVPAPQMSNTRMKGDGGVFMDLNVCQDDDSVLAVEISGAETAVMSWNRAGETRSQELTPGEAEWTAPLGQIDDQASDVPILVTIEATGPGGTTRTSAVIFVADCSPPTV